MSGKLFYFISASDAQCLTKVSGKTVKIVSENVFSSSLGKCLRVLVLLSYQIQPSVEKLMYIL